MLSENSSTAPRSVKRTKTDALCAADGARRVSSEFDNGPLPWRAHVEVLDGRANELKAKQLELEREVRAIYRERNTQVPVNRLPVELLSAILEWVMLIQGYRPGYIHCCPRNVSQVCSHWRSVALSTPSLFACIGIDNAFVPLQKEPSDRALRLKRVVRYLARSKSVPFHFTYYCANDPRDLCDREALVARLTPHCSRLRSLFVMERDPQSTFISALPTNMPLLEDLTIGRLEDEGFGQKRFARVPFRFPRSHLASLSLRGVALQIPQGPRSLEGLRSLHLYRSIVEHPKSGNSADRKRAYTSRSVPLELDILREMPNLEHLAIKRILVTPPVNGAAVHLLKLKSLHLSLEMDESDSFEVDLSLCFFQTVDVPNLRQLELAGMDISAATLFPLFATKFPSLETLVLRHLGYPISPLVKLLDALAYLRKLDLHGASVSDEILIALSAQENGRAFRCCPHLQELYLRGHDGTLSPSSLVKMLESRYLDGSGIQKIACYPLHDSWLPVLRTYVPYIIVMDPARIIKSSAINHREICVGEVDPTTRWLYACEGIYHGARSIQAEDSENNNDAAEQETSSIDSNLDVGEEEEDEEEEEEDEEDEEEEEVEEEGGDEEGGEEYSEEGED